MGLFTRKNRRATDKVAETVTVLGTGFEFSGDLTSTENLRVEGRIKGNCDVRGAVTVGADCTWEGNINADVVIVQGKVHGDIHARKKLDLMAGARVTGDITAPAIAMDVGAICEGQIHMQDQVQLTNFEDRRAAS
jgi:cytoskeletal protein CcmA (bactofilin family)